MPGFFITKSGSLALSHHSFTHHSLFTISYLCPLWRKQEQLPFIHLVVSLTFLKHLPCQGCLRVKGFKKKNLTNWPMYMSSTRVRLLKMLIRNAGIWYAAFSEKLPKVLLLSPVAMLN